MSKSEQPIASIDNRWLMEIVCIWKNIEFVQQAVAQLSSIEDIERELMGFDGDEG